MSSTLLTSKVGEEITSKKRTLRANERAQSWFKWILKCWFSSRFVFDPIVCKTFLKSRQPRNNIYKWKNKLTFNSGIKKHTFSAVHRLCVIGSPRGAMEKFDAKRVGLFFLSGHVGRVIRKTWLPRLLLEMEYFRWNSQKSRLILKRIVVAPPSIISLLVVGCKKIEININNISAIAEKNTLSVKSCLSQ